MSKDMEITEIELHKIKEVADKYPYLAMGGTPPIIHWCSIPGNIYVCLTKVNVEGKWKYQLLASARWGRVHDVIIVVLLNILKAPSMTEEKSDITDSTRCFLWNC